MKNVGGTLEETSRATETPLDSVQLPEGYLDQHSPQSPNPREAHNGLGKHWGAAKKHEGCVCEFIVTLLCVILISQPQSLPR